jgi:hypothetical protein
MSAEKAADTLHEVLAEESKKKRLFKSYASRVNKVMDMYVNFVSAWYSGKEFMEVFLNPTDMLQIAPAVNAVLAGNEARHFAVKWRMWLFYFFVRVQKFAALSPRLSFVPKPAGESPSSAEIARATF